MKIKNKIGIIAISSAIVGSMLVWGVALAAGPSFGRGGIGGRAPGIFGTVSAISGNTLTVTSKGFGQNATPATYSVDASNATVTKNGSSSSISSIAIGDTIMAQGTVSGTNVVATSIRDGVMNRTNGAKGMNGATKSGFQNSIIKGNGQPVVGGTVASISGTSLTITNASNVTYTVDASSATVEKNNATSTVGSISVNDRVVVQGAVSGNSITASSILDQGVAPSATSSKAPSPRNNGGFMGTIKGFFHKMFGFF